MSVSKMDKVLLGITVAIASVAAGAIRLWMGFPVLVVGVIAAVALVRLLNAQQRVSENRHSAATPDSGHGIHPFGAFGPYKDGDINPATGMPMRGMYDAGGNRWMRNRHHESH